MKKKFKSNFPVIAIAAAIAACLILTGIILARQLTSNTTGSLTGSEYLENAYITSSSDGKITFLYDGEICEYEGVLSSDYTGIADVVFEDGKMVKIYTKSNSQRGTLLSCTDDAVRISGYGVCDCENMDGIACYVRKSDGTIEEGDFSDCIVGTTEVELIFQSGIVCAAVMTETESVSQISVLLKNGDSIYRDDVYVTADAEYTVGIYDSSYAGNYSGNASDDEGNSANDDDNNAGDGEGNSANNDDGNPGDDNDLQGNIDSDNNDNGLSDEDYSNLTTYASGKVLSISSYLSDNSLEECEISCTDGVLYLCDADGNLLSEGYEGTFHIMDTENGYVTVNTLALEDYVRYVLPSEMPASFSYEALKAQAVCARTFACSQIKNSKYAQYGANLDDSTSYQVYNSSGTNETMDQAVADTAGEVLTCDGSLITCYYYSTSPGFTTTTSVWGNDDSPSYLVRRNCLSEQGANTCDTDDADDTDHADASEEVVDAGNADYDLSDESVLKAFLSSAPESYDSASAFYRWTATVNLANITDSTLGILTAIKVVSRNESGYVTELECTWEKGTTTLTNENTIRRFLGAGHTKLTLADGTTRDFTTIPSACFCITETNGSKLTLLGGGFGHGVGMSQYGADAMGDAGWTYEEILMFYYNDVSIFKQ